MDNWIQWGIGILVAIIGYFLVSLHNRLEDHLRASAESDTEFAMLKAKQEEQCDRLDRVENKVDKLSDSIAEMPFKVVEALKAMIK